LAVIVEKKSDPVNCDGRFAASGRTLYDDMLKGGQPDDRVLFLLDGSDNIAQHRILFLERY
jgi:hypothetical protein